jgi:hypothetical protein
LLLLLAEIFFHSISCHRKEAYPLSLR